MKIKTSLYIGVLALCLLTARVSAAAPETFTTGEDWAKRMTRNEKLMSLLAPTVFLQNYGVPIQRPPQFYAPLIDKAVAYNPKLLNEDIASIFASTVYYFEPQTRPALDELETNFLRGDLNYHPLPQLTIQHQLREQPEPQQEEE